MCFEAWHITQEEESGNKAHGRARQYAILQRRTGHTVHVFAVCSIFKERLLCSKVGPFLSGWQNYKHCFKIWQTSSTLPKLCLKYGTWCILSNINLYILSITISLKGMS